MATCHSGKCEVNLVLHGDNRVDEDPFAIAGTLEFIDASDDECSVHDFRPIGNGALAPPIWLCVGLLLQVAIALCILLQPLLHTTPQFCLTNQWHRKR